MTLTETSLQQQRKLRRQFALLVGVPVAALGVFCWLNGPDGPWTPLLVAANLLLPLVALAAMVGEAPQEHPFRATILVLLAGVVPAFGLGWLLRGRTAADLFVTLVLGAAWMFVPIPALLVGAVVRRYRHVEWVASAIPGSPRVWFGLALLAGTIPFTFVMQDFFHDLEVGRAKAWIEALAVEVRTDEAATGKRVTAIGNLRLRVGEPPLLLRSAGCLEFRSGADGPILGFGLGEGSERETWEFGGRRPEWKRTTAWRDS